MSVLWPVPVGDTGIGVHSDPNAYYKPSDFEAYADDLLAHKSPWFLHWFFDEGAADFIEAMRRKGIEVIGRPGPAKMPNPMIDVAHLDAYIEAGVRWFVIMNELNLHEEWVVDWKRFEKPVRKCADQFVRYADIIRGKGDHLWVLTPPPSLGGHMNHREWFTRFMYAMCNIAAERGQTLRQLLYHCGIGIHCRSVGNPLEAGPSWYDCSSREWEWFRDTLIAMLRETREEFEADPIPFINTEALDQPDWLPRLGGNYDWGLWERRNLRQMSWFNPDNEEYRYPSYVVANCFWVIHTDRFSPWPQCGLYGNYPHFLQRGDYTTNLWRAMPAHINWTRRDDVEPGPTPEVPEVKLRVYDFEGTKQSLEWVQGKYGVQLEQCKGKGWHVSQMRERVNAAAGMEMFFYDDNGAVQGLPVEFHWPGGCDCDKKTEVDGKVGFAYNAWIWDPAVGGPYWIEVPEPSDSLGGLGMLAMTNHDHLDFVWKFGVLEGSGPVDPLEVILPLAEEKLQAIPVPNDWAYPAKAIENGHPIQVGGYAQVEIGGVLWGYQTFTNEAQDSYGVAYSPEGQYDKTEFAVIERD